MNLSKQSPSTKGSKIILPDYSSKKSNIYYFKHGLLPILISLLTFIYDIKIVENDSAKKFEGYPYIKANSAKLNDEIYHKLKASKNKINENFLKKKDDSTIRINPKYNDESASIPNKSLNNFDFKDSSYYYIPVKPTNDLKLTDLIIYKSDQPFGKIGLDNMGYDFAEDNIFNIEIKDDIQGHFDYFLSYKIKGLNGIESVNRVINNFKGKGGRILVSNDKESQIKEKIEPSQLFTGLNHVLFNINQKIQGNCTISDVQILAEPRSQDIKPFINSANKISLQNGETYLYLNISTYGIQKINVLGKEYILKNNSLEEFIPLENEILQQKSFNISYQKVNTLTFDTLTLAIPNINYPFGGILAVDEDSRTMDYDANLFFVPEIDAPPLGMGIINVTSLNRIVRLKKTDLVQNSIKIPFDMSLFPAGKTINDLNVFNFDYKSRTWKSIKIDSINKEKQYSIITIANNDNTDYINGIIKSPEPSDASAFSPTTFTDIQAVNPISGVNLISPPSPSQKGDANISYPLNIPAGRQGMQPSLTLNYNSSGGASWIGYGWNLNISSISLDTKWGSPLFHKGLESEIYALDGEQLIYLEEDGTSYLPNRTYEATGSGCEVFKPRAKYSFHERKLGSFNKIERMGDNPTNYWWIVTTPSGVVNYYGSKDGNTMDPTLCLLDSDGNIAHWALAYSKDVHDNSIDYTYSKVQNNLYPNQIYYTGIGLARGKYNIKFYPKDEKRLNAETSGRLGLYQVDNLLLDKIHVNFGEELIRSYHFDRVVGAYDYELLSALIEKGRDKSEFYRHNFDYYNDLNDCDFLGTDVTVSDPCGPPNNCIGDDSDSDGTPDACDPCPNTYNPIGMPCPPPPKCGTDDADKDGIFDLCDNCPTFYNPFQENTDGDEWGDACDNCKFVKTGNQANKDMDLFGDACDNCIEIPNDDQLDTDNDLRGDVCDNCPLRANNDQADTDTDGVGNICDNCVNLKNPDQLDGDLPTGFVSEIDNIINTEGDGVGHACDNCPTVYNPSQEPNCGCNCTAGDFKYKRNTCTLSWTNCEGFTSVVQWFNPQTLKYDNLNSNSPFIITNNGNYRIAYFKQDCDTIYSQVQKLDGLFDINICADLSMNRYGDPIWTVNGVEIGNIYNSNSPPLYVGGNCASSSCNSAYFFFNNVCTNEICVKYPVYDGSDGLDICGQVNPAINTCPPCNGSLKYSSGCTLDYEIAGCTGYRWEILKSCNCQFNLDATVLLSGSGAASGTLTNLEFNGHYVIKFIPLVQNSSCPIWYSNTIFVNNSACQKCSNACACSPDPLNYDPSTCQLSLTNSCKDKGFDIALEYFNQSTHQWEVVNNNTTHYAAQNGDYRVKYFNNNCPDAFSNTVTVGELYDIEICTCNGGRQIFAGFGSWYVNGQPTGFTPILNDNNIPILYSGGCQELCCNGYRYFQDICTNDIEYRVPNQDGSTTVYQGIPTQGADICPPCTSSWQNLDNGCTIGYQINGCEGYNWQILGKCDCTTESIYTVILQGSGPASGVLQNISNGYYVIKFAPESPTSTCPIWFSDIIQITNSNCTQCGTCNCSPDSLRYNPSTCGLSWNNICLGYTATLQKYNTQAAIWEDIIGSSPMTAPQNGDYRVQYVRSECLVLYSDTVHVNSLIDLELCAQHPDLQYGTVWKVNGMQVENINNTIYAPDYVGTCLPSLCSSSYYLIQDVCTNSIQVEYFYLNGQSQTVVASTVNDCDINPPCLGRLDFLTRCSLLYTIEGCEGYSWEILKSCNCDFTGCDEVVLSGTGSESDTLFNVAGINFVIRFTPLTGNSLCSTIFSAQPFGYVRSRIATPEFDLECHRCAFCNGVPDSLVWNNQSCELSWVTSGPCAQFEAVLEMQVDSAWLKISETSPYTPKEAGIYRVKYLFKNCPDSVYTNIVNVAFPGCVPAINMDSMYVANASQLTFGNLYIIDSINGTPNEFFLKQNQCTSSFPPTTTLDFGDGSPILINPNLNSPYSHTYSQNSIYQPVFRHINPATSNLLSQKLWVNPDGNQGSNLKYAYIVPGQLSSRGCAPIKYKFLSCNQIELFLNFAFLSKNITPNYESHYVKINGVAYEVPINFLETGVTTGWEIDNFDVAGIVLPVTSLSSFFEIEVGVTFNGYTVVCSGMFDLCSKSLYERHQLNSGLSSAPFSNKLENLTNSKCESHSFEPLKNTILGQFNKKGEKGIGILEK